MERKRQTRRRPEEMPEGRLTAAVRRAVLARDGAECVACGSTHRVGVDHMQPGGGVGEANLQVLCGKCNSSKNRRPVAEWLDSLRAKRARAVAEIERIDRILSRLA